MICNLRTAPLSSAASHSLVTPPHTHTHDAQSHSFFSISLKNIYSFITPDEECAYCQLHTLIRALYIEYCVLHICAQYLLQNKHEQVFCSYIMNLSNIYAPDSILVFLMLSHMANLLMN